MLGIAWTISGQPLSAQNAAPGSVDPSFAAWPNERAVAFVLTQSNDLFVAGQFGAVRLTADGAHNPTFAPTNLSGITALALQPDGKLLAGFRQTGDVSRFLPDGSLDSSFNFVPPDAHWRIVGFWTTALAVQPDGGILVAGYRLVWSDDEDLEFRWAYREVYRLFPDGSVDRTFGPYWAAVRAMAVLTDDRILVAGNDLAVLHPDGTRDTNFAAGPFLPVRSESLSTAVVTLNTSIGCLAIQPDGRILVGGSFTNVQGHARSCLARVQPDGRLDLSFNPPAFTGADWPEPLVNAVAIQGNGKILVAGVLRSDQWPGVRSVVRLNPDGSVDSTFAHMIERFDDDEELMGSASSIVIQDQARAVVGGRDLDLSDLFRIHLGELVPPRCDGFCITSFSVQSDVVTLAWRSEPEQTYYIDFKAALMNDAWTPASGSIIAQGTETSWSVPRPSGMSAFYRVVKLAE
jgi:uncharacterized delta-60 repeat protein